MVCGVVIKPVGLPLEGLARLCWEAREDGHSFLDRLVSDWDTTVCRFDRGGEMLLGVYSVMQLVGVGGLTVDPYADDPACGRLRHIYVARSHRRQCIGRLLVGTLIVGACATFDRIRLRTPSAAAAALYERMGFKRIAEPCATHVFRSRARPELNGRQP